MADRLTGNVALDRLRVVSDEIVVGVVAALPRWAVREVGRIVDAWVADGGASHPWEAAAARAGDAAAERVGAELRALFALDVAAMTRTPLEVVRTAVREPTAVLAALGIAPVARDEFDSRSWPDDRYGLTPATLGDLGDADLGPLLLAWGMAKAAVLAAAR
ncbi:MAG: hypothetical protein R6X23_08070 [Acidimicrobiia bacterium]